MPAHGGMTPGAERYGGTGGGAGPTLKKVIDSLAAQLGTAYDTSSTSNVFAFVEAYARAIAGAWSDNARLANQWDAQRMTDFLSRWEAIFGITPNPSDTMPVRRARIMAAQQRVVQYPTYQAVTDALRAALGSVFVTIVHTGTATNAPTVINGVMQSPVGPANVWTPSGWPVGQFDATGAVDWYSNVAHLMVQVTQPAGMRDGDFYTTIQQIGPVLDGLIPAWVTYDWFRVVHTNGTAAGFYLDGDATSSGTLVNLDNESLSV